MASMADIQSDCHGASVMSIAGKSSCYYRCINCGKECTVRAAAPQVKTPADAVIDEFCLKIEKEMESPAQELREAERLKFVTDSLEEGKFIERKPFVAVEA